MIEIKSKQLVFTALMIFFLVSCEDKEYKQMLLEQKKAQDSISETIEGKALNIPKNKLETIRIEGCEYLIYKEEHDNNSAFGFMAHKGNCSNSIHKPIIN